MKIIIESKLQFLVIFLLALASTGSAQLSRKVYTDSVSPKHPPCDTLIAERLDLAKKIDSKPPLRLYHPLDSNLISPGLSKLLKDIRGELLAYRFKGARQTALLMHTTRIGDPVSEDSIQDWFVQVGQNVVRFKSIATNPNLLFWDKEGGLNYFTVLYSEVAMKNVSSNFVSLDFKRFRLLDGDTPVLIEEQKSVRCMLTITKPR